MAKACGTVIVERYARRKLKDGKKSDKYKGRTKKKGIRTEKEEEDEFAFIQKKHQRQRKRKRNFAIDFFRAFFCRYFCPDFSCISSSLSVSARCFSRALIWSRYGAERYFCMTYPLMVMVKMSLFKHYKSREYSM